jgi:hypothetical protein
MRVFLGAVSVITATVLAMTPAAAVGAGWGHGIQVPGISSLNTGGSAVVESVSCPSAGNCVAGGFYNTATDGFPFVASEVHGVWHDAMTVPGVPAHQDGAVTSVSCASTGNCTAALSANTDPMVVSEVNGVWQRALVIPGIAKLATGSFVDVNSVSCGATGYCTVGGDYAETGPQRAFIATQVRGVWHDAVQAPGTEALNTGGDASVVAVSCRSAGDCGAGGYYTVPGDRQRPFVMDEVNGVWHKAVEVPGIGVLSGGHNSEIYSESCASGGNCAIGGYYVSDSRAEPMVASEVKGVWHDAMAVPGVIPINTRGPSWTLAVSCAAAGDCIAGGPFTTLGASGPVSNSFVAGEVNGAWHKAIEVPGLAALNTGGDAEVQVAACGSVGNCTAGGYYTAGGSKHAFVADEVNGVWQAALPVPGLAAMSHGDSEVQALSCGAQGNCAAGGYYTVNGLNISAFVASRS